MDTAATVSPYRGKLFRLQVGAVMWPHSGANDFEIGDVYDFDSGWCLGLEGQSHVPELKTPASVPNFAAMDLVEVLCGQRIFWVGKSQIISK